MNNISELVNYLQSKSCDLDGCSTRQVEKIETYFKIQLPLYYKEFLYTMGMGAGKFMRGSSVFYPSILKLRKSAEMQLDEDEFKPLPANVFVFFVHQGYQFAFFYLDQGDNPPVYYYEQGEQYDDFKKEDNSFMDFLEKELVMSGLI